MVDRIQITQTCYTRLDGQWQIVHAGVIDVPAAQAFRGVATPLAETPSPLGSHGGPTTVRNVVKR